MMDRFKQEKKGQSSHYFYERQLKLRVIRYFKKWAMKSISIKSILSGHLGGKEKVIIK